MEWNGDILQATAEDDDIAYVVPREGSILWEDALAIPRGAPHPRNAHAFINFILEAGAGAAIAEAIRYATPNAAAKALLPADYTGNPGIFPTEETLAACEPALYRGRGNRPALRSGLDPDPGGLTAWAGAERLDLKGVLA